MVTYTLSGEIFNSFEIPENAHSRLLFSVTTFSEKKGVGARLGIE